MKFTVKEPRHEHELRVYCFEGSPEAMYVSLIDRLLEQGYALTPPFYDIVQLPGLETKVKVVCVLLDKIIIRKTGRIPESEIYQVTKALETFDTIIQEIADPKTNSNL